MLSIYTESMEICKPFFSEKPLNFAKIGQDEKAGGWERNPFHFLFCSAGPRPSPIQREYLFHSLVLALS